MGGVLRVIILELVVERSAFGWVGGTGALQGIRWYQTTGSAWGAMNFALFAGNGW